MLELIHESKPVCFVRSPLLICNLLLSRISFYEAEYLDGKDPVIRLQVSQQRTSQQSSRILIFSEAVGVPVGEANLEFFISCFGTDDEGQGYYHI